MKRFVKMFFVVACLVGMSLAFAVEVPPISAQEFVDEPAHWIWSILASDIAATAISWLLTTGVIALLGWLGFTSANKWFKAVLFILRGVNETYEAYVRPAKIAAADGKLTDAERKEAMRQACERAKDYAAAEGIPFVQTMSVEIMSAIAELVVSLLKGRKVETVVAPLSSKSLDPVPEPPLPVLSPLQQYVSSSEVRQYKNPEGIPVVPTSAVQTGISTQGWVQSGRK